MTLLIVQVIGVVLLFIMAVVILAVIVRAVRRRDSYEMAAMATAEATAAVAVEAQEVSNKLVHLKGEHIQLTGYIHKAVHDQRDNIGALSMRVQANHAETMKELADIVDFVKEMREQEASAQANDTTPAA